MAIDHVLDCPFCGVRLSHMGDAEMGLAVKCANCGAVGPAGHTRQKALNQWNRRANPPDIDAVTAERDALLAAYIGHSGWDGSYTAVIPSPDLYPNGTVSVSARWDRFPTLEAARSAILAAAREAGRIREGADRGEA